MFSIHVQYSCPFQAEGYIIITMIMGTTNIKVSTRTPQEVALGLCYHRVHKSIQLDAYDMANWKLVRRSIMQNLYNRGVGSKLMLVWQGWACEACPSSTIARNADYCTL